MPQEEHAKKNWLYYAFAASETILTFTLASFLLGFYIIHRGDSSVFTTVFLAILYVFIVAFSIYRMVRKFSLAAVMLMIPIAPLLVLIIFVSLIHLLQLLK